MRVLVLGYRLSADKELTVHLEALDKGVRTGSLKVFPANKKTTRLNVGWTYEIPTEGEEGRTFVFGEASDGKRWQPHEECEAICATSRAAKIEHEAIKLRAKQAKDDEELTTILTPLIHQYARLKTRNSKLAFELLVLETLRRFGNGV